MRGACPRIDEDLPTPRHVGAMDHASADCEASQRSGEKVVVRAPPGPRVRARTDETPAGRHTPRGHGQLLEDEAQQREYALRPGAGAGISEGGPRPSAKPRPWFSRLPSSVGRSPSACSSTGQASRPPRARSRCWSTTTSCGCARYGRLEPSQDRHRSRRGGSVWISQ